MALYDDTETAKRPLYDLGDGNGEQVPSAAYVDEQDGTGERLVWSEIEALVLNYDNNDDGSSGESGISFVPQTDMDGVRVRLSSGVDSRIDEVLVKESYDGAVLETVTLSSPSSYDVVDVVPTGGLSGGSRYTVNVNRSDGGTYRRGRYEESSQYPYSGTYLEVTDGVYSAGGSLTQNVRYNFDIIWPINPV